MIQLEKTPEYVYSEQLPEKLNDSFQAPSVLILVPVSLYADPGQRGRYTLQSDFTGRLSAADHRPGIHYCFAR